MLRLKAVQDKKLLTWKILFGVVGKTFSSVNSNLHPPPLHSKRSRYAPGNNEVVISDHQFELCHMGKLFQ